MLEVCVYLVVDSTSTNTQVMLAFVLLLQDYTYRVCKICEDNISLFVIFRDITCSGMCLERREIS